MELVEEEPDIFDIAHAWLYTSELTWSKDGEDVPCNYIQLADLFVLADKVDMPSLCNKAIDGLKSIILEGKSVPGATLVNIAYTKTPENSPLRKHCVAAITFRSKNWCAKASKDREKYLAYPEFLFDVSLALQKQITQMPASIADAPFLKDNSFHQPAEDERDQAELVE